MTKNKRKKYSKKIIPEEIVSSSKEFGLATWLILVLIFIFAFYIRAIVPYDAVLNNGVTVGFAMDDSVYHMRLVEHTINSFPVRIFFDPFTLYPYGSFLTWGVLHTYIVASLSMLFSFITGLSIESSIGIVGAFIPAIIGSLIIFPVYFIGKELSGVKTGLLAAFIVSILSGQLLSRSVLGFSDHHVAEAFFSTLMIMFFLISLRKSNHISSLSILTKGNWKIIKTPLLYSVLTGIAFGSYILTWTTGILFAVILMVAITIQYIILFYNNKDTNHLAFVGIVTYLTTMIVILPFVNIENGFSTVTYSFTHIIVTGGSAICILFFNTLVNELKRRDLNFVHFILVLVAFIAFGLILLKSLVPVFYSNTMGAWNYIFVAATGGSLTIAEGMPLTSDAALNYFGLNYYISMAGLALIGWFAIKTTDTKYTLIFVWSAFILPITLTQNKYAYYYSVNVAVMSAFTLALLMSYIGFDLIKSIKQIKVQHVIATAVIIVLVAFVPLNNSPMLHSCGDIFKTWSCTSTQGGSLGDGQFEWYESLTWMRNNTPEPDLDYYGSYEKTKLGQTYNYSKNDYGVMSWWDYGHIITYWGHRIPNANPFQSGIGGGAMHDPGASTFLVSQSEKEANTVLDKLGINGQPGARYIISNAYMAYAIQPVFAEWDLSNQNYYMQTKTSSGPMIIPTEKYYNTIESKLHILDTNGLTQYRLVHESKMAPWFRGANEEKQYKAIYNQLYGKSIPIEDSGYVKIFEYVKGATISTVIEPNTDGSISTTIRTNIGRTFVYSQTAISDKNGKIEFKVPYSTTGPLKEIINCATCLFSGEKGNTQFDTMPIDEYTITFKDMSKKVSVSEKSILTGETILV